MRAYRLTRLALLGALISCAPKDSGMAKAGSSDSASTAGATMKAEPMMAAMRRHVDSLMATPGMLHNEMAAHTTMTMDFVNAAKSDLATVGYNDPGYQALVDSVVQDLHDLPNLSGAAAAERERAHLDRVHRLMSAYETAMHK